MEVPLEPQRVQVHAGAILYLKALIEKNMFAEDRRKVFQEDRDTTHAPKWTFSKYVRNILFFYF